MPQLALLPALLGLTVPAELSALSSTPTLITEDTLNTKTCAPDHLQHLQAL